MKRILRSLPHWPPVDAEWGYGAGAFPLSETIHREVLSLPMGPQLTAAQQQRVLSASDFGC